MIPALRTMTRPREPPETAFQTATGTRTALFLMDNLRRLPTGIPRSPDLAFANLDLEPQSQDWNSNQSVTPTRNRSVTYVLTRPGRCHVRRPVPPSAARPGSPLQCAPQPPPKRSRGLRR